MSLNIKLPSPIGINAGPRGNGVLVGKTKIRDATKLLRVSSISTVKTILKGTVSGEWYEFTNVTEKSLCVDFTTFNAFNNGGVIAVSCRERRIKSIFFLVSRPGIGTGNWNVAVKVYNGSEYISVPCDCTENPMKKFGIVKVKINAPNSLPVRSELEITDEGTASGWWYIVSLSGVETMTVVPKIEMVTVVSEDSSCVDNSYDISYNGFPVFHISPDEIDFAKGDLDLIGYKFKFIRLISRMYENFESGEFFEFVYSTINGIKTMPLKNIILDETKKFSAEPDTINNNRYQLFQRTGVDNWDRAVRSASRMVRDDNGVLQFQITNAAENFIIGLANTNGGGVNDIAYGFRLNGDLEIVELGVVKQLVVDSDLVDGVLNQIFYIKKTGTLIEYWADNNLVYTSLTPATLNHFVQSNLYTAGVLVDNVSLYYNGSYRSITWDRLNGANTEYGIFKYRINKISGGDLWNAGCCSDVTASLDSNSHIKAEVVKVSTRVAIGYSVSLATYNPNELSYGVAIIAGIYTVYEGGVVKFSSSESVAVGDTIRIEKTGDQVDYYLNHFLVYSSVVPMVAPEYRLVTLIRGEGGQLKDVSIVMYKNIKPITWQNVQNVSVGQEPDLVKVKTKREIVIDPPRNWAKINYCGHTAYFFGVRATKNMFYPNRNMHSLFKVQTVGGKNVDGKRINNENRVETVDAKSKNKTDKKNVSKFVLVNLSNEKTTSFSWNHKRRFSFQHVDPLFLKKNDKLLIAQIKGEAEINGAKFKLS